MGRDPADNAEQPQTNGASAAATSGPDTRWVNRVVLVDAKGSVRDAKILAPSIRVETATMASDNHIRVYECLERLLSQIGPSEETDISALLFMLMSTYLWGAYTRTDIRNLGSRCFARCEHVATAIAFCAARGRKPRGRRGVSGVVKIIQLSPSRHPITLLSLGPSPPIESGSIPEDVTILYAITSISWAPSCGRSYHLVATCGRDGHVRVWKLRPSPRDDGRMEGPEETKWSGSVVTDFDHRKSLHVASYQRSALLRCNPASLW